jgi:hypothetical protein
MTKPDGRSRTHKLPQDRIEGLDSHLRDAAADVGQALLHLRDMERHLTAASNSLLKLAYHVDQLKRRDDEGKD